MVAEPVQLETIVRLARACEHRDDDTGMHTQRVGLLCSLLAQDMGWEQQQVKLMHFAAPLHDVGKIGIPDSVLLKPGKLDGKEWECMKSHTLIGAKIMSESESEIIRLAESVALTHHEKFDGSGYPHGLSGQQIPIFGRRIIVILKSYRDSM